MYILFGPALAALVVIAVIQLRDHLSLPAKGFIHCSNLGLIQKAGLAWPFSFVDRSFVTASWVPAILL